MLDKQDAERIAAKLGATLEAKKNKKRPHDLMEVYEAGILIASFGIRRGSKKGAGHDHIKHDLYCSPHFCKELAQCSKSRADWIKVMRDRHKIDG